MRKFEQSDAYFENKSLVWLFTPIVGGVGVVVVMVAQRNRGSGGAVVIIL